MIPCIEYNVIFTGSDGKSFEIKKLLNFLCNPEVDIEKWKGLWKGDLKGNGTQYLIKFKCNGCKWWKNSLINMRSSYNAFYKTMCKSYSKKNLWTMKCRIEKGKVFMVEQIDFSMWKP